MTVCDEMKKLREYLDSNEIEWADVSSEYSGFYICRTHFTYGENKYSVVNGYGTCGGYNYFNKVNDGLLEMRVSNKEPIGHLTADEVIEIIDRKIQE